MLLKPSLNIPVRKTAKIPLIFLWGTLCGNVVCCYRYGLGKRTYLSVLVEKTAYTAVGFKKRYSLDSEVEFTQLEYYNGLIIIHISWYPEAECLPVGGIGGYGSVAIFIKFLIYNSATTSPPTFFKRKSLPNSEY